MRLLLVYRHAGAADETALVREHDADVTIGESIQLPEPLGPIEVRSVADRGADLGMVHGDDGTLQELINQGWSKDKSAPTLPGADASTAMGVGVSLHEWAARWERIEKDRPDSPGVALQEVADLLGEILADRGVPARPQPATPELDDAVRAYDQAREVAGRWRRDEQVEDREITDAYNQARTALESIAARHRSGGTPGGRRAQ
jgi:hypothetical protein